MAGRCHQPGSDGFDSDAYKVVLVGNPNVGKSVVFGRLTGRYADVSNYPGTTVEVSRGFGTVEGRRIEVVDTPGVNSLVPASEDEMVTRRVLLEESPDVVVQVADAKNLRRALIMTSQLADLGYPMVLALNMMDEAKQHGISIDVDLLSKRLGVPVVPTTAVEGRGVKDLRSALLNPQRCKLHVEHDRYTERAIEQGLDAMEGHGRGNRFNVLTLLTQEEYISEDFPLSEEQRRAIEEIRGELLERYQKFPAIAIYERRSRMAQEILDEVLVVDPPRELPFTERLSKWTMEPLTGIPIFLLVLYVVFKLVGEFGAGTLVDFLEGWVFGQHVNPWITTLISTYVPSPLIRDLLVGQYGLVTVGLTYSIAIVLPIVTTFFLMFGILEDSGYLPRLTIMANGVFRRIGLSGKAVLPMILGLGCDTMATLTARILDTRKERVIATLLLALGVPCSAQLGVILGMLAVLGTWAMGLVFLVVLMQLLLVGYLASKILPGERSDFIIEIPPLRVPKLSNVAMKTLMRVEWFLFEAVPLFILGSFILFALDRLRVLGAIERLADPLVVGWLGLPTRTTDAFLMGFLRRDYGAAGLFALQQAGQLSPLQVVVSLVVITLFVPCIANLLVIIKERGVRTALAIVAFIIPYAFLVGGILNIVLRAVGGIL